MPGATVVGGLLGLGVQVYVNAVRKLPLVRNPWEHVIAVAAGAAFANFAVSVEERTAAELAVTLQKREDASHHKLAHD